MISQVDVVPLLIFGAHPDDIEFGCGGVVMREARQGRSSHFVICSRGEAASRGTAEERVEEARISAKLLGATLEFLELDGDSHLEVKSSHAIGLASVIRRIKPDIVLAPSPAANQHPDHSRLGILVRDASRLARYGGVRELVDLPAHFIKHLFFFAVTPGSEPAGISPIYFDVSDPEVIQGWIAAMIAHASQTSAQAYIDLQLAQARVNGLRAGVEYAIGIFPNEPLLFDSFDRMAGSLRKF